MHPECDTHPVGQACVGQEYRKGLGQLVCAFIFWWERTLSTWSCLQCVCPWVRICCGNQAVSLVFRQQSSLAAIEADFSLLWCQYAALRYVCRCRPNPHWTRASKLAGNSFDVWTFTTAGSTCLCLRLASSVDWAVSCRKHKLETKSLLLQVAVTDVLWLVVLEKPKRLSGNGLLSAPNQSQHHRALCTAQFYPQMHCPSDTINSRACSLKRNCFCFQ